MSDFETKLKKYETDMFTTLGTLNVDDIKTDGVSMRIGAKVFHLIPAVEEPLAVEEQIRKEFHERISAKLSKMGEVIKSKMAEVSVMVSSFKEEYERKEILLKDTLAKAAPMPNINWEHARKGISVVKGNSRGEMNWLVKRLYNPKTIDGNHIEPLYVKKLMTNIVIVVKTVDSKVSRVTTHYANGLDTFEHYHQAHPDCWGNWKFPNTWATVDDILRIADDAACVLENINSMSIAQRNPRLMPRFETLRRHVLSTRTPIKEPKIDAAAAREGIGVEIERDIWGN